MSTCRLWPAIDVRVSAVAIASGLDDLLLAALDEFHPTAIDDQAQASDGFRVYFAQPLERSAALEAITNRFAAHGVAARAIDVPDEGWAERSQAALRAVRVGQFLIAPPWDVKEDGSGHTIIIQPSMGFGTGHHQTTRLCLAALQAVTVRGRDVADVGTGSGVLAIAAAKLGAARVTAIDIDADALQSARENLALNGLSGLALHEGPPNKGQALATSAVITLHQGDVGGVVLAADVVTANLTGALLVTAAPDLLRIVRRPGYLILSGFQTEEENAVLSAFGAIAAPLPARPDGTATLDWRRREDDWIGVGIAIGARAGLRTCQPL